MSKFIKTFKTIPKAIFLLLGVIDRFMFICIKIYKIFVWL